MRLDALELELECRARIRATSASSGTFCRSSGYKSEARDQLGQPRRLMTSSRIVCRRVSSSAVTDGLTNASDTCCRSTSTVAAARYRFGSETGPA